MTRGMRPGLQPHPPSARPLLGAWDGPCSRLRAPSWAQAGGCGGVRDGKSSFLLTHTPRRARRTASLAGRVSPRCAGLPVGVGDITWHLAHVILVEPAIGQSLLDVGPLHGVGLQQRAQEVDGSCGDSGPRTQRSQEQRRRRRDSMQVTRHLPAPPRTPLDLWGRVHGA